MTALRAFSLSMFTTLAGAAVCQTMPEIDGDLLGQLDFRDTAFSDCFGEARCEINDYRITAWHRHSDRDQWHPALIYWDPIDGFGILGSGQDDEIDVNERLIVQFPTAQRVQTIWLSDLFVDEIEHYRAARLDRDVDRATLTPSEEVAGIELRHADREPLSFEVSGNFVLPEEPFNQMLDSAVFLEGGDLRQRLVIEDGQVSILSAALSSDGTRTVLNTVPLDQIDPEKQGLFAGEDGDDFDFSAMMSEGLEFDLEPDGTRNFERLSAILSDRDVLEQLRNDASVLRTTGDVSNGEVSGSWINADLSTSVMFHAKPGTSSDFSVAGIIFQDVAE